MFDPLSIAATGMTAQKLNVDTIANNLANVNTPAFKRGAVQFTALVVPDGRLPEAGPLAAPVSVGIGVRAGVTRQFEPGALHASGSALDLALSGEGFLEVTLPDGSRGYVRGGPLQVNAEGQLVLLDGLPLKPAIQVPEGAQSFEVSASGRVQARLPGQAAPLEIGQLELVRFANPQGLQARDGGVYRATEASGEPIAGRPGEDGLATLAQGFLEGSNVKLLDELVGLLVAQRAYEANARAVQAADELESLVNGLRR